MFRQSCFNRCNISFESGLGQSDLWLCIAIKICIMDKQKKTITRRSALERIGGLSLSLPFLPSILSSVPVESKPLQTKQVGPIKDKPNILWITTEGVPLSVLGCYGSKHMPTPNIDRIAKEGMLFTNSFCNNALCAPSRATLLTGKFDHLNGMVSNPGDTTHGATRSYFDPTQQTFAQILKKAGYKTGMVGK